MSKPKTKKEWVAAERHIKKLAIKLGINAMVSADKVRRASGTGTGVFERNRVSLMVEAAMMSAKEDIVEMVMFMEGVYFGTDK